MLPAPAAFRSRFALVALAACLLEPAPRAQSGALDGDDFQLPPFELPTPEPPPSCAAARDRANALLPEVEADTPAEMQAALRKIATDLEPDQTPAEGWDHAASLANLDGDVGAALWAELLALQSEWQPEFATAAGVYLHLVGRSDDALIFLNCAYADGCRSPYLLEALANLHHRAGRTDDARHFVREAVQAAPDDPVIRVTAALIETGRPPPPPPPDAADPMDRALAQLLRQIDTVMTCVRQTNALQDRVDAAGGGDDRSAERRETERGLRESWLQTVDGLRPMIAQTRQSPPELRPLYQNMVLHSLITMYISVTGNMLGWCDSVENPWGGSSVMDVSFWGEALGLEPVELTRRLRALADIQCGACRAGPVAGGLDDFGGAPFAAAWCALNDWHREARARCGGSKAQMDRCLDEADRKWCAAARQLLRNYVDTSEVWFRKGARGYDRASARRLASAALVVDDVFRYASTWAREMKFPPGDATGTDMMRNLQEDYDELVDIATGIGDFGDGPGQVVKTQAAHYLIDKQNAEVRQAQFSEWIESRCQPVDLKLLEQLAQEHADAVRSMLLDRLLHDVDAEWDPNASCTFSAGKYFRASIDIEGKTSVGGNWKWLDKKLPGWAGEDGATVAAARNFKVNFKDGDFVGASAGVDRSAKYGPFTGKASATMGMAWDSKSKTWKYPVEFGGTLGFGLKTRRKGADGKEEDAFGFECIPGKARIRFDARVVAKDAMAYVAAVRGK